jgi:chemotaxis protein CheD
LQNHGIQPSELVAKIAGCAGMFSTGQFMQVGEANVKTAITALEAAGLRIAGQHVGGTLGRRVCFDLATGSVTVECIGHPSHTI